MYRIFKLNACWRNVTLNFVYRHLWFQNDLSHSLVIVVFVLYLVIFYLSVGIFLDSRRLSSNRVIEVLTFMSLTRTENLSVLPNSSTNIDLILSFASFWTKISNIWLVSGPDLTDVILVQQYVSTTLSSSFRLL